ncbi:prepilin-type N-terminal cleavage/methylation domain-containing protein [Edwardsiella tarda]|uniref:Prepilin-type N-terminal cleavage/methylation domain-containing protein n=1 Tax=Edwardsiella tarda ATCC 15947 = NBRC 105688 TaxID=667121 RepID=A0AC61TMK7_EDWTA|nr:prepilin-type N-terminal cleavage/methylation domain-containing protein [Edwardsiella tarda ATCC 15947 = NBRC 105688]UCQ55938.1 prepilin-type N-terminal cleavage/methylation domain-containing protein [Edwardsiella tarda]
MGRSPAVGSITSPAQRDARQRGSGLLEVMVALLLTSVGLLGLIQTQRALLHTQRLQLQRQEAWRCAREGLAQAALHQPLSPMPPGWRRTLESHPEGTCQRLRCRVSTPLGDTASLEKLICP